jgi:hypothetical protein
VIFLELKKAPEVLRLFLQQEKWSGLRQKKQITLQEI